MLKYLRCCYISSSVLETAGIKKGENTKEMREKHYSTAQQIIPSAFKIGSFLCISNERMLANFKIRTSLGSFILLLFLASVPCVTVTLLHLKLLTTSPQHIKEKMTLFFLSGL